MKTIRTGLMLASIIWAVFAIVTGIASAKNFRLLCVISQSTVSALCLVVSIFLPYWIDGNKERKND